MVAVPQFGATVLAENTDGSRRVVIRTARSYGKGAEQVSVGAVDVYPDGRSKPVGRSGSTSASRSTA